MFEVLGRMLRMTFKTALIGVIIWLGYGVWTHNGNAASTAKGVPQPEDYDNQGRRIVRGPVQSSNINNLRIVSDSVGIVSNVGVRVSNSVIEAPICMSVPSVGNLITNNVLNCDLGINFGPGPLLNNRLFNNQYRGQLSNRPNRF